MQAFAVRQDTPPRKVFRPPLGVGVVWIFQALPFQLSAQVWVLSDPTASQAVAEVHDTLWSWLVVDPDGAGVLFSAQPRAVPLLRERELVARWLGVEPHGRARLAGRARHAD